MATYKVLQDIEAEDTLIGPLTLRQCIYAAIAVVSLYLCFIAITKGAAFLIIFLLPFVAFGLFFAFPWSKQQSTEVWALAKVRFYLKPRKRIWNQSGVKELVTITVPKNLKRADMSHLTPNEVKSRLKALADTIDSRGWAIKNVDMGYYTKPSLISQESSDRLISPANMPQEVPNYDTTAASDIFDVQNNPVAQKFDVMMNQAAGAHRQQIMAQMAQQQNPAPAGAAQEQTAAYWHLRNIAPAVSFKSPLQATAPAQAGNPAQSTGPAQTVMPAPVASSQPPAGKAATATSASPADYSNMRAPGAQGSAQPGLSGGAKQATNPAQPTVTADSTMTGHANPAILELANNNDLDVATIAREAQARSAEPPDEVVVSFH